MVLRSILLSIVLSGASIAYQPATAMSSTEKCQMSEFEKTVCMLDVVLQHLKDNYAPVGGGIDGLRVIASNKVEAVMLQEERADVWTFTLQIEDGKTTIVSIEETTK